MPLVHMKDLLEHAYRNRYAVGAFEPVDLEHLAAILAASERSRSPVILSLSERHRSFDLIMPAAVAAAYRANVPITIHLEQGQSLDAAVKAIRLGCTGVSAGATEEDFPERVETTRAVVEMARGCGVPVEGELGHLGGTENESERGASPAGLPSPTEAKEFVARTGVDFLAVFNGSVPGTQKGAARIDTVRLTRINEAAGIPLAFRCGSSLSDSQFRRLIDCGVAKIHCLMDPDASAGKGKGDSADPSAVVDEIERLQCVWGCAGRAAEVLVQCRPWREVEHLIVYNVREELDEEEVSAMMAEGREVLSQIPGVRRVFTGRAVQEGAAYRYCWLVRFSGEPVIASYRDHPLHCAFADGRFRPSADGRISIDYQEVDELPFPNGSKRTLLDRAV